MIRFPTLVALLLLAAPALAQAPPIEIRDVWSRAAMGGRVGAVFLTIVDRGAADRLIGVSSPVAAIAEVHETKMDDGIMKMRPVAALAIGAGEQVVLAPGGYHIMLMHLNRDLREGDRVPVVLTFEKAGRIDTEAAVGKPGGPAPR